MNTVFGTALQCMCMSVKVGRFCYRWSSDCTASESAGSVLSRASSMCVSQCLCHLCPWLCLQCSVCSESSWKGTTRPYWFNLHVVSFFLALSLLVTHTCSLKYHLNLSSVFSLLVRECMFRIAITDKMRSDNISSRGVYFKMMTRLMGNDKLSRRDEMNIILGQVKKVQKRVKYLLVFFEVFWSDMSALSQINDSSYYKIILLCLFFKKNIVSIAAQNHETALHVSVVYSLHCLPGKSGSDDCHFRGCRANIP